MMLSTSGSQTFELGLLNGEDLNKRLNAVKNLRSVYQRSIWVRLFTQESMRS